MNNKEFNQELLHNIQPTYYKQIEILSLSVFLSSFKTIT
jgi:hypothetical protein